MITPRTVRSICRRGRWLFLPVAGSLVLTGTLAAAAQPMAGQPVMGIPGFLSRVSAVSASDAWAVGSTGTSDQPLIVHWNGAHWSQVTSPNVPTGALSGVSMVSVTDGWAVGTQFLGPTALIEHWNGTNWALVPPPHISGFGSSLRGVSMVSATDGWAVGYYDTSNEVPRPLVLHWNGTRWAQVPISVSSGYTVLFAVSAASKSDALAVGTQLSSTGWTALTLHWNGTSWTQVPSPNPSPAAAYGVSDASPGNAWTVGRSGKTSTVELPKTLTLHWSGTAWQHVFSPNPGPPNELTGVALLSTSNAWSVGDYNTSTGGSAALTLHWNGTNWARVPNQGGTTDSFLTDVTMVSVTDGWAVGGHSATGKVIILHWNGTTWSRS
jgi:hypothetical protein